MNSCSDEGTHKRNPNYLDVAQSGGWQGNGEELKKRHTFVPFLYAILQQHYLKYKAESIADFGGGLCSYAERL